MKVLIRADAGAQVGAGHVMRCLAIAQECRLQDVEPRFVLAAGSPALEARLQAEGLQLQKISEPIGSAADAAATIDAAKRSGSGWVIADGYLFSADYQRAIRSAGLNLLVVDDYVHADFYAANIVLNPNLHARPDLYGRKESSTRLLLGPSFAPLRREFVDRMVQPKPASKGPGKLLVTMGGGDDPNVTLKVLKALRRFGNAVLAKAVIGGANPHRDSLAMEVAASPVPIELLTNVSRMPELMDWADVAVSAGGSTSWELAYMGLPAAQIILAENQRAVAESLAAAGASINLGRHEELTEERIGTAVSRLLAEPETRSRLADVGRTLVDGKGARRIVSELTRPQPTS
jgi:UDP-2,4-diacetamido-2,4,6-trideoxy-beta-L-altropyranose hydrolase